MTNRSADVVERIDDWMERATVAKAANDRNSMLALLNEYGDLLREAESVAALSTTAGLGLKLMTDGIRSDAAIYLERRAYQARGAHGSRAGRPDAYPARGHAESADRARVRRLFGGGR